LRLISCEVQIEWTPHDGKYCPFEHSSSFETLWSVKCSYPNPKLEYHLFEYPYLNARIY